MRAEGPLTAPVPLVVGVGNRGRGDDGVGPTVVDALEKLDDCRAETQIVVGDLSDLVMQWGPNQDVVVVDAMVSGAMPGTVLVTDALESELPTAELLMSSHGVGLAETVELGRLLNRLPRSLAIVTVEGRSFGQFDSLTPEVANAVPSAIARILELLTVSDTVGS